MAPIPSSTARALAGRLSLTPNVHARLDLRRAPRLKRRAYGEHRIIEREKLLENVHNLEGHFEGELNRMAADHPIVKEVRGMGFFWAVEVKPERADGRRTGGRRTREVLQGRRVEKLLEGGLICRFDDKDDPVIQYSPALVSDRESPQPHSGDHKTCLTELEKQLGYRS